MSREVPGTNQKALQVNLDATRYGTFVEIGAGQEVARMIRERQLFDCAGPRG